VGEASGASVVIVEVGGTVGDIEGLPFLEAIRQMRTDVGRENVLYIHVTLLPYISSTGELKTSLLSTASMSCGASASSRTSSCAAATTRVTEGITDKLALFCSVEKKAVIPLMTVQTIYEVPLILEEAGLGNIMMDMLGISNGGEALGEWRALVDAIKTPGNPPHRPGGQVRGAQGRLHLGAGGTAARRDPHQLRRRHPLGAVRRPGEGCRERREVLGARFRGYWCPAGSGTGE